MLWSPIYSPASLAPFPSTPEDFHYHKYLNRFLCAWLAYHPDFSGILYDSWAPAYMLQYPYIPSDACWLGFWLHFTLNIFLSSWPLSCFWQLPSLNPSPAEHGVTLCVRHRVGNKLKHRIYRSWAFTKGQDSGCLKRGHMSIMLYQLPNYSCNTHFLSIN